MAKNNAENIDAVLICPNCNFSAITKQISEEGKARLECVNCGSVFSRNSSSHFYNFSIEKTEQEYGLLCDQVSLRLNSLYKQFLSKSINNSLCKAIKLCSPKVILDIGCGNGAYSNILQGYYNNYYGFEPSPIPEEGFLKSVPLPNICLIQYTANKPLLIKKESIDVAMFIASYDHIPEPKTVFIDVWDKVKPGGFVLICMSNYGFWLKRFINLVLHKRLFLYKGYHYCVHSPETLVREITSFASNTRLFYVDAESIYIPNLPVYFSSRFITFLNNVLKFVIKNLFKVRYGGQVMIIIFQKIKG